MPGTKGDMGRPGMDGRPGPPGRLGEKGDRGFAGALGQPVSNHFGMDKSLHMYRFNYNAAAASDDEQGIPGVPGKDGVPGRDCRQDTNYLTGNLLVRHSQTSSIPLCEAGEEKLWDGYSLLYIEGNEKAHHQDLGKSA